MTALLFRLTTAVEGGLIQGWKRYFTVSSTSCEIIQPDIPVAAASSDLTVEEITGPLLLMCIGLFLSLLGFAYEFRQLCAAKHFRKTIVKRIVRSTKGVKRYVTSA